jgi:hypothetical protein
MAFDFGQGLSEMGKAVATTGGELVKADLEQQKITLADQLAGAREEKQRSFLTSERVATQQFTSGENTLQRANAKDIAMIGADAAVKSAGIHAGGAITAARIGAESQEKRQGLELEAMRPVREAQVKAYDAETLGKTVAAESQKNIFESRKELDAALASGDQTQIKTAQMKNYAAEFSAKEEVQRASVYQAQAKLIENALAAAQARLVSIQEKGFTPESQALAKTLDLQVKKLQTDLNAAIRAADDAVKNLPTFAPSGASSDTKFDLTKYLPRVGAAVGVKPKGIINNTPSIETPGTLLSPGP